jgi:hypothetical protein
MQRISCPELWQHCPELRGEGGGGDVEEGRSAFRGHGLQVPGAEFQASYFTYSVFFIFTPKAVNLAVLEMKAYTVLGVNLNRSYVLFYF